MITTRAGMIAKQTNRLNIKPLKTKADWLAFQNLRLHALREHPEAFGASYEEESVMSAESFKAGYKTCEIFGAFSEYTLVGCAGFYIHAPLKMRHRGVLFSVYVTQTHRHKGIASSMVKAVIEHAKKHVLQLHATVVTSNQAALHLYQKNGFILYGTEPRSLSIDHRFYDEHMMILRF